MMTCFHLDRTLPNTNFPICLQHKKCVGLLGGGRFKEKCVRSHYRKHQLSFVTNWLNGLENETIDTKTEETLRIYLTHHM